MMSSLYHQAIKDLARSGKASKRLETPNASVKLSNDFCGDQIQIELCIIEERISQAAHETRGCLLCCASAALIVNQIVGMDVHDFNDTYSQIQAYLRGDGELPETWRRWDVFQPVRHVPSRHSCVLLPIAALSKALHALNQSNNTF